MSILLNHDDGWIVSHKDLLRVIYKNTLSGNNYCNFNIDDIFNLNQPFIRGKIGTVKGSKKRKRTTNLSDETVAVEEKFNSILKLGVKKNVVNFEKVLDASNDKTRQKAYEYFESITKLDFIHGGNNTESAVVGKVQDSYYLFPANCLFYNADISEIGNNLGSFKYDFILLDPPWNNRFIKRRKKFHPEHGYDFLDCHELKKIPLRELLNKYGIVAIWTTNSKIHIDNIKSVLFPSWGITWTSTWFWIKITESGELITPFTRDGTKQPFERLMFGCRKDRPLKIPEDLKCIISVPSSIHSHKPPVYEVLKDYLPEESNNLEIFARYLLPNWTSYGNQVLSLQLKSLYSS